MLYSSWNEDLCFCCFPDRCTSFISFFFPIITILASFFFPNSSYLPCCRNWELTAPWTGAQIKVPVKFIVGDQDLTYNSLGAKDYIAKGGFKRDVPFLQDLVVMEGVGHFINEEKPEEISKHIYDFFQKSSSLAWFPSCCLCWRDKEFKCVHSYVQSLHAPVGFWLFEWDVLVVSYCNGCCNFHMHSK
jgi:hypothetical protein